VNITDANQFQPATISVPVGAAITWVNSGRTIHTVTDDASKAANPSDAQLPAGAQAWDSGNVGGGATFMHTFETPGEYTYFCSLHEFAGMIARISVRG